MTKESAGIVLYQFRAGTLYVMLGHMGGPLHANKDAGSWSIPKGRLEKDEDARACALREFQEETGLLPQGDMLPLTTVTQKSGKRVHAWAMQGNLDVAALECNLFRMEWPPRSGMFQEFPELDRVAWFTIAEAQAVAIAGQAPLFAELYGLLQETSTTARAHGA